MGAVFFQFYVGDVSAAGVDVQFYFIVSSVISFSVRLSWEKMFSSVGEIDLS